MERVGDRDRDVIGTVNVVNTRRCRHKHSHVIRTEVDGERQTAGRRKVLE